MIPRVIDARYEHDFVIHLKFSDGTEGEVDLEQELYGEVFQPLVDLDYFKLHTLTWPNGAEFAPEFLFEKMKVTA